MRRHARDLAAVQTTPSKDEALAESSTAAPKTEAAREGSQAATAPHEAVATLAALALLGWEALARPHALRGPSAWIWFEVGAAFAFGGTLNVGLASILWRGWRVAALLLCALLLAVPYSGLLPVQSGIGASAVALIHFVGVWKALDVLAGTRPDAILAGGFGAFATHFASPVEYKLERHRARPAAASPPAIVPARDGLWRHELAQTARAYALLAMVASLRSALQAPPGSAPLRAALQLYSEVWTIFLFLSLFTGSFSLMLACAGFAPTTMFDAPLTRATSISEFWSKRWNLLIHGLFRRTVFAPLTARGAPAWLAGVCAFALSGAFHEYAFALQQPDVRKSLGRCALFFLAQAPVVSAEKALRRRVRVPALFRSSALACTLAWSLLLVPLAPLFLHPLKTSPVFEQIFELVPRLDFGGLAA